MTAKEKLNFIIKKYNAIAIIIELNSGKHYLLLSDKTFYNPEVGGCMPLYAYNDNLETFNSDLNINRIYVSTSLECSFKEMLKNKELVWKRPPEEITMTLSEIKSKLGIDSETKLIINV